MATKGAKIYLDVKAPGGTTFKINSFRGIERISDLFEYTLVMTTKNKDVSFDQMIGGTVTVSLSAGKDTRYFTGIIGKFEQEDTPFKPINVWTVYRATLYPKLWLLTLSGECRIFQNKTTIQIIKAVLDEHQVPFKDQLRRSGKEKREYCVQYNESDFNFISRLMEEEGIYYFFDQSREGHKLILTDNAQAHSYCPGARTAAFHDAAPVDQFLMKVSSCFITQRIVPRSDTLKSYNYLTPKTALKSTADGSRKAGGGSITNYRETFPTKARGDDLAKVKIQADDSSQKRVEGVSTVPFFLAGYRFKLERHPRVDANQEYVLYEVIHEATIVSEDNEPPLYQNTYNAFPSSVQFRAEQKTPKPRIYGSQTAKVTGKKNEEIYTEEYGRIKVKFHWDPSAKTDETTSCWIRVATMWSGKKWGTLFTPRIGQEVVVSFIDGDPDKPLIVGSVYNGDHKPPYLPGSPTKSTIKSQTSKATGTSSPGFNELRFEDKKYSEEIYMHAQKDFNMHIQNDHNITLVGGSRHIKLKASAEKNERRTSMKANDTLKLSNGDKTLTIVKGDYKIKLTKGDISVTCLSGDVKFKVIGDISFKCTGAFSVDALKEISFKAGQSISGLAGLDVGFTAGAQLSAKAGGTMSLQAGGMATLEAIGSTTVKSAVQLALAAPSLGVTGGGSVEITGGGSVGIKGGGSVDIKGGGAVNVKGGLVAISGGMITLG
jgi:type VI secretion system secreted protein VgrG